MVAHSGGGSRRPPQKTTGTYPPQGAAAAAGSDQPVPVRQWPMVAVLTVVAVGLAVTALGAYRAGVVTLGTALLIGAVLRLVLPDVGLLAVRSRYTDVSLLGVLGVVIVLLALSSLPDPVINLPVLGDLTSFLGHGG